MPTSTQKYLSKVVQKSDPNPEPKIQPQPLNEPVLTKSQPEISAEALPKSKIVKTEELLSTNTSKQLDSGVHHKTDQRIAKLESSFKARTNILIVIVLITVSINLIFIFSRPQNTNQSTDIPNSTVNQAAIPDSKAINQASVYIFENNPAIFDFGFKIDLKPDYIANLNDPNCKTPIVPPTVNGCGFGLDLQKIGLPKTGVYYRSIALVTDTMTTNQKIQIDLKDYEKGQIAQNVGTVEPNSNSQKIILPSDISNSQSLYFRFWAPQNVIKIKKIIIDFFSTTDLKPVKINLATPFNGDQTGVIYLDSDGDGKFSQDIDKRWECIPTFPGVLPIKLKDQTSFKLIREDGCITENKLDSWQRDSGLNSLPAAKWLLVIDPLTVASFETKADTESTSIDLKF